jgi:hypothetical protein
MKIQTSTHPLSRTIVAMIMVTAFTLSCAVSRAAILAPEDGGPTGPKDWPVDATKHVVVIKRDAADEKQSAIIAAAEATLASQQAIQKAAEESKKADPAAAAIPQDDKTWWYEEKLGTRIPYAITNEAITYYVEFVNNLGKKAFKSYAQPSSSLDYHASVTSLIAFSIDEKTFKDVNVVTMNLTFSANFTAEATSGLGFSKTRVVVLDASNKVLHISGDGPTEAAILML